MLLRDVFKDKKVLKRIKVEAEDNFFELWRCKKGNVYFIDVYTNSGFVCDRKDHVHVILSGVFYELMYGEENPFISSMSLHKIMDIVSEKDKRDQDKLKRIVGFIERVGSE